MRSSLKGVKAKSRSSPFEHKTKSILGLKTIKSFSKLYLSFIHSCIAAMIRLFKPNTNTDFTNHSQTIFSKMHKSEKVQIAIKGKV